MKISLDGCTWQDAPNGVWFEYKLGGEGDRWLLGNLTHKGLILDVTDEDGDTVKTASLYPEDLEGLTR